MLRPILFCIHFLRCVPRIFLLKILWTFCLNVIASFQLMLVVTAGRADYFLDNANRSQGQHVVVVISVSDPHPSQRLSLLETGGDTKNKEYFVLMI